MSAITEQPPATTQPTFLHIPVTPDQLATIRKRAAANGKTVPELLALVLLHLDMLGAVKPLVLLDADRQHLEKLLARNLTTASELVSAIQRALTCDISGLAIELKPRTLTRLETRKGHMSTQEYLQMIVPRLLDEHVGLR